MFRIAVPTSKFEPDTAQSAFNDDIFVTEVRLGWCSMWDPHHNNAEMLSMFLNDKGATQ
jgi:hypothetical protein